MAKKTKDNPFEGVEFGPWVRTKRLSVRHRTDRRPPAAVKATSEGTWLSPFHGVREWKSRRGAELATDRVLTAGGATFGAHVVMDEWVSFRVSPDMLASFKAAARGLRLSDWMRGVLCAAAGDWDAGTPAEVVE